MAVGRRMSIEEARGIVAAVAGGVRAFGVGGAPRGQQTGETPPRPGGDNPFGGGGSGDLPPGFEPVPDDPGYAYNRSTGEVGRVFGDSFQTLSQSEAERYLGQHPELVRGRIAGPSFEGAVGLQPEVEELQREYTLDQLLGTGDSSRFDTGPGQLDLANRQFAFESGPVFEFERDLANRQYALDQLTADRAELAGRAGAGLSLADLARELGLDEQERYRSPANFPALLAGYAGLEPNAGASPLVDLLGQGFKIEARNPLADERYARLLDDLYTYAQPNQDLAGVREAYARDPEAARRFFSQRPEDLERQFPQARQLAHGGSLLARRPKGLVDIGTGKLDALIGERGDERLTVQPVRRGGFAPDFGARVRSRLDELASGRSGGAAEGAISALPAGGEGAARSYTPAQGTAVALAKALRPLGFVPLPVIQRLESGQTISPNMLGQWINRPDLPPSLRQLVLTAVEANLGATGTEDFLAEAGRYQQRGFGGLTGAVRR